MSTRWPSLAARLGDGQVERYLGRIGYRGGLEVSQATLQALQTRHMVAVPFENLHVHAGLAVQTDLNWSYRKVVEMHRGGWGFELNGAFAALLAGLGFEVERVSARVWDRTARTLGPELDHLCLLVEAECRRWLVDVGAGDTSLAPLEIPEDDGALIDTEAIPRRVRIERHGDRLDCSEWIDDRWELRYVVTDKPLGLATFSDRSEELRRGGGSGLFRSKPFATRALDASGARVWLLRNRVRLRDAWGLVTEDPVEAALWRDALWDWFGLTVPTPPAPSRPPRRTRPWPVASRR